MEPMERKTKSVYFNDQRALDALEWAEEKAIERHQSFTGLMVKLLLDAYDNRDAEASVPGDRGMTARVLARLDQVEACVLHSQAAIQGDLVGMVLEYEGTPPVDAVSKTKIEVPDAAIDKFAGGKSWATQ